MKPLQPPYPAYRCMKRGESVNVALCFAICYSSTQFRHALITDQIVDCGLLSARTSEFTKTAPLYCYEYPGESLSSSLNSEPLVYENMTEEFREYLNKYYAPPPPATMM